MKTHLFTEIRLTENTENTFIYRKHIYSQKTHLFIQTEIQENTFIHRKHIYSQNSQKTHLFSKSQKTHLFTENTFIRRNLRKHIYCFNKLYSSYKTLLFS